MIQFGRRRARRRFFFRILEVVLKHEVKIWQLLLFLGPAVLVYGIFSALPLVQTLGQGFFVADDNGSAAFAGLPCLSVTHDVV